jgi:succinate dehydrogenase / fumarate reductase, cytochrome b subunit
MNTKSDARAARPLSPHLQIYKPIPTMVMSIAHRMTGAALYFGTLLVAWWLIAAATSEEYFNLVNGFFGSFLGRLVLFGYTWALIHHMLGGIRHLIWDTGAGMDKDTATKAAYATIAGSVVLTFIIWIAGYAARGS